MSNSVEISSIPAAWYEDPTDASKVRWWDGNEWTDAVTEAPVESPLMTVVPAPRHHPDTPPAFVPQQVTSVLLPQFVPGPATDEEPTESLYTPPPRYSLAQRQRFTSTALPGVTPVLPETHNSVPQYSVPRYSPLAAINLGFTSDYNYGLSEALPSGTTAVWAFAVLPVLHFLAIWATLDVLQLSGGPWVGYFIVGAPLVVYVYLAYLDRNALILREFEEMPRAFWAILPPLYLVWRAMKVGTPGLIPLVVWLLLQGAAIAYLLSQATAFLTVVGA